MKYSSTYRGYGYFHRMHFPHCTPTCYNYTLQAFLFTVSASVTNKIKAVDSTNILLTVNSTHLTVNIWLATGAIKVRLSTDVKHKNTNNTLTNGFVL